MSENTERADEPKMPTRLNALTSTAKKLIPGRDDADTLSAAALAACELAYLLGTLVIRAVLFALLPLSILVLYPLIRANQRRSYQDALGKKERRDAMIAELTKSMQTPIEWPHDWAKPIPSADLYRAAAEAAAAEQIAARL